MIEWTFDAIGQGVVGAAAWAAITKAGSRMRDLIDQLRREEVRFNVSRGAAALLAVDYVRANLDVDGGLVVNAVDEPSALLSPSLLLAACRVSRQ